MKKVFYLFTISLLCVFFWHEGLHAQGDSLIGKPAPGFKLKNVGGNMLGLKNFKKEEGVILVFTCNHCPFSQLYEQRIIELHQNFAPLGFPVVAINPNDPVREPEDSFENMVARAKDKEYPFAYLFDNTQNVARAYGATRTPHVFLLKNQGKGKFTVEYVGAIDDNARDAAAVTTHFVEDAVRALKAGQQPGMRSTKAIGCTIKWKEN